MRHTLHGWALSMSLCAMVWGMQFPASVLIGEEPRAKPDPVIKRPRVAGEFELHLRDRPTRENGEPRQVRQQIDRWKASETAIIVIDMWDDHYCKLSAQRVGVMVPKMNAVLNAARSHGVLIIHSPSGTLDHYAGSPYRLRMTSAPPLKPPFPLNQWCYLDPAREPELPVDVSVCACDDPVVGPAVRRYTRQHAGLDIIGFDGISDNGEEIYNVFEAEGIKNIVIMGVHTNMCVLGRPFGIRHMVKLGKNVALCRDLTDSMYDPRQPPFVSHARGTELVIEHIEQHWCPSILSTDLLEVVAGTAGP